MKFKITAITFALLLSGCATPQQIKETTALHEVHKAERKVTVDKIGIATTSILLKNQKENLATDKETLEKNKEAFDILYNQPDDDEGVQ